MPTEFPPIPDPVPPKPKRLCINGWIPTYLEYTKNQASPSLFHQWTAVATMAGVLRRNIWIDQGGYYSIFPNFYVMLVAPTGRVMKSTAAGLGIRLLRKVGGVKLLHEKMTPEGLISFLGGEMKSAKQKTFNQALANSLKDIAEGKDLKSLKIPLPDKKQSNCFIFAPELATFIGSTSYSSGLIETLTSLYDNPEIWEYRTRTQGELILENVNVNMLCCSTPMWLAKGFSEDSFGGGFMGRNIFIFQDEGKKKTRPKRPAGMAEIDLKLTHDLIRMSELEGEYFLTVEADTYFDAYSEKWFEEHKELMSGRMSGFYERKPDHILKLSMILAASMSDEMLIHTRHIKAAIDMLDEVEKLMPKAFVFVGATNEAFVAQHVIGAISTAPGRLVAYRRLLASVRHMIKNRREFDDILDTLLAASQIRFITKNNARYFLLDDDIAEFIEFAEKMGEKQAVTAFKESKEKDLAEAAGLGNGEEEKKWADMMREKIKELANEK